MDSCVLVFFAEHYYVHFWGKSSRWGSEVDFSATPQNSMESVYPVKPQLYFQNKGALINSINTFTIGKH